MSVGTADFQKALNTAWSNSALNAVFKALWPDPTAEQYVVLHDQEATPGQPRPYCVIDTLSPSVATRMSGGVDSNYEVRDILLTLNIFAEKKAGESRSVKELAAYLAEEVMKVFGGHPTVKPTAVIALDNGGVLPLLYQTDYGTRINDDIWQWTITYLARTDVPVMS
jgi:hypothetical protein